MNMKAIITKSGDNAYTEMITHYFEQKFPRIFKASKGDLLEIITEILVGSKDVRFGPAPKPESLVKIRSTIRKAIKLGAPIPALVPWGGRKGTPGFELDAAEISALWQLITIDETLKRYYEPGLQMNVRIEDLNAYWLYKDEKGAVEDTDAYSQRLHDLILILRGNTAITPLKESCMTDAGLYWNTSQEYADMIFDYLTVSDAYPDSALLTPEWKRLEEIGWTGTIPTDQREYYTNRYKSWEPGITHMQANRKLADYFGGSKARLDLKAKGEPHTEVGSYIQLNFTPPVPGAPSTIFDSTLYYRTLPLHEGRTHIAPWRAKGYLEIDDYTGRVATKLTSFGDHVKINELIPATTMMTSEKDDLSVTADTSQFISSNGLISAMVAMNPFM